MIFPLVVVFSLLPSSSFSSFFSIVSSSGLDASSFLSRFYFSDISIFLKYSIIPISENYKFVESFVEVCRKIERINYLAIKKR